MKRLVGLVVAVVPVIILLAYLPVLAIDRNYVEDFTTTAYKDAAHTTAWWDWEAGELKLFPLPTLVGSCNTPGWAWDVAISGDYAFVADFYSGLQVIDISDPMNPTLAGTCDTPFSALGVAISGHYAFVADGGSGLQVIYIGVPLSPVLVGTCDTPDFAGKVTVSGDYAYVADYGSGLQVIDISDPTNPALAGSCDTPGIANGVTVSGDHAFVADDGSGLQVIDISDPTNPALAGSCNTPGNAKDVTVSGSYAFVADDECGLQVIDISDPTNPALAGTCDTPGNAYYVTFSGDRVFVGDGFFGLQVIDISDPSNPTLAGNYNPPRNVWGIAISGGLAYVANYDDGLQVIKIAELVNPTLAGTCDTPGSAYDVAVSGIHAFVTDGWSGLQVIDISDPTNPTLAGTCALPVWVYAYFVAVSGDRAFVTSGDGLRVINISDPSNPMIVGFCDTPGAAYGVAISGDHAYVASWSGLQVIDISDPENPTLMGFCDAPGEGAFHGIAVSGNHAFVADSYSNSGLQVIDVSDPWNPIIVGACLAPGMAFRAVTVSGDYAFMAEFSDGLQVIDISDPTNPMIVGTCDTPGDVHGVTVSGNYAFVADGNSGLKVIDISDPATPVIVGSYEQDFILGVTISGNYAFVTGSEFQVLQVFQSEVDTDKNVGRSLAVDASDKTICRARLEASQAGSVSWDLSADGGANWQEFSSYGSWDTLHNSGSDLLWRSTHTWTTPGVNPATTHLEIDWLYDAASIDSIVDVPDDQGGWAQVHFTRSGRDFPDERTYFISYYGVWRRVDNAALLTALETQSLPGAEKSASGDMPEFVGMPVVTYQGKTYIQSSAGLAAASFPPGTWVWVGTVTANKTDFYYASVPTAADSSESGTNAAVYVVTAHTTTPSIWYASEPDTGYSVDNIAPAVPEGFAVAYNTGSGNQLLWDPSPDEDFQYFRIYRSSDPDFVPWRGELVHSMTGTSWSDPEYDRPGVYYKITALDYVGNESGPASPGTVTEANGPEIPQTYGLYPNVPNPFNPSTSIRYDVPAGGGAVTLRIYDVSGRLVRTLVDGPQPAGQKTASWNGKDDRGRSMASGVYFCRLEAPGYKKTMKMVLVQ